MREPCVACDKKTGGPICKSCQRIYDACLKHEMELGFNTEFHFVISEGENKPEPGEYPEPTAWIRNSSFIDDLTDPYDDLWQPTIALYDAHCSNCAAIIRNAKTEEPTSWYRWFCDECIEEAIEDENMAQEFDELIIEANEVEKRPILTSNYIVMWDGYLIKTTMNAKEACDTLFQMNRTRRAQPGAYEGYVYKTGVGQIITISRGENHDNQETIQRPHGDLSAPIQQKW